MVEVRSAVPFGEHICWSSTRNDFSWKAVRNNSGTFARVSYYNDIGDPSEPPTVVDLAWLDIKGFEHLAEGPRGGHLWSYMFEPIKESEFRMHEAFESLPILPQVELHEQPDS